MTSKGQPLTDAGSCCPGLLPLQNKICLENQRRNENNANKAKQKQQNPPTQKDLHINIYSQTYTKIFKRNKKEMSDYFPHSAFVTIANLYSKQYYDSEVWPWSQNYHQQTNANACCHQVQFGHGHRISTSRQMLTLAVIRSSFTFLHITASEKKL